MRRLIKIEKKIVIKMKNFNSMKNWTTRTLNECHQLLFFILLKTFLYSNEWNVCDFFVCCVDGETYFIGKFFTVKKKPGKKVFCLLVMWAPKVLEKRKSCFFFLSLSPQVKNEHIKLIWRHLKFLSFTFFFSKM